MKVNLGINTCFAVKRWPEPADWARLVRDELGLDLVQHSLDLVELGAPDQVLLARQAAHLKDACAAHGLTLDSTFTGLAAYSSNILLHPDAAVQPGLAALVRPRPELHRRGRRRLRRRPRRRLLAGAVARPRGARGGLALARGRAPRAGRRGLRSRPSEHLHREPGRGTGARHHGPGRAAAGRRRRRARAHPPLPRRRPSGGARNARRGTRPVRLGCATSAPASAPVHIQQSDAEGDHHWPFTATRNAQGRIDAARVLATLGAAGRTT